MLSNYKAVVVITTVSDSILAKQQRQDHGRGEKERNIQSFCALACYYSRSLKVILISQKITYI